MSSPKRLPHVTEILRAVGLAPDYSRVPPDVLEAARARGTARHAAIEADHYGVLEPDQEPLLGGYRQFLADTGHKPLVSEPAVMHRVWGYCGHPDRVGRHGPDVVLIDWKPMGTNLVAASYQLAAYRAACDSMLELSTDQPVTLGLVVELTDDSYRMTDVTTSDPGGRWPGLDEAWHVFLAALVVYRAQQEVR